VIQPTLRFIAIKKANHAKGDWRKIDALRPPPCPSAFWWFALLEKSAHLARKTAISVAEWRRD
jgi:hypothetical protein